MRTRHLPYTIVLVGAAVLFPPLASMAQAQTAEGTPNEEAEKHYRNGIQLRTRRQDDAALHEFRHAYELSQWPRALAQIGVAEQALGLWVDAESHLLEAMLVVTDPWIVKNKPTLDASLAHIRDHLATIEISGGVAGAEVRINGKLVGTLPLERPVRAVAGTVALDVRAGGFFPLQRSVTISPRGLARETVDLVPNGQPIAPGSTPVPGPGGAPLPIVITPPESGGGTGRRDAISGHALAGWVTLGAAAVALGLGVTFQLVREGHISDFNANDKCMVVEGGDVDGGETCRDNYKSAATAQTRAVVGFVVGGVLTAGAAVLLLTAPPSGSRSAQTAHVLGLRCGPGPGSLGLACAARF